MNILFIIVIEINEIKNDKNIMFHFCVKYKKFELKNKIYKLFKHTISNHIIDFIKNKQSFYDFIYFLSKNEFKIFAITLSNVWKIILYVFRNRLLTFQYYLSKKKQ